MLKKSRKVELPSDDNRWKIVQGTMRRNGYARHSLIETLHTVQESFGFLDKESLHFVAESLRVPLSQVYGVSTFYHLFSLKPAGKHACVTCTGTACYIKGAPDLLKAIEEKYGIKPEETTEDGSLSLLTARCVGSCGLGPVALIDGNVAGKLTKEQLLKKLQEVVSNDA